MLELRSLDGIRWRFSSIGDTLLLWHLKCQKFFFYCSSSVGSAPFPSTTNFSPEIPLDSYVLPLKRMAYSFWRWSQIWKTHFCHQKASSGSVWALIFFGAQESWCVDTQADCVDTTSYCFRTGFYDSDLVSTHRCTVSTPQADYVDTQADCVNTTGYYFRIGFWDSELVSTHRLKKFSIIAKLKRLLDLFTVKRCNKELDLTVRVVNLL
ncbi:hypothetical protein Taro_008367 [Colocasia esculenta]|uniref:Uncharacterized protein n=1 Tax=Colocasia esculenta TaxID=4460 RepID=A0A843U2U6_COLES|nr:hypothetical protein [Colocasia esculenta]